MISQRFEKIFKIINTPHTFSLYFHFHFKLIRKRIFIRFKNVRWIVQSKKRLSMKNFFAMNSIRSKVQLTYHSSNILNMTLVVKLRTLTNTIEANHILFCRSTKRQSTFDRNMWVLWLFCPECISFIHLHRIIENYVLSNRRLCGLARIHGPSILWCFNITHDI